MEIYDLPVATQKAIRKALRDALKVRMGGELPALMTIKNMNISHGTISLELFGGMEKVADVKMNQETYTISHLEIVEEDDEC